jgi:pimeloyl-ACP methyl ester carboxylesterase
MVEADGAELCTESFGRPADPPILLIMGIGGSMLWWEEGFCRLLAEGRRFVIRYDHRDTGRSVTYEPGEPEYTGADLIADAVGVLDAYGIAAAHVVAVSAGGGVAQLLALEGRAEVLVLVDATGLDGGRSDAMRDIRALAADGDAPAGAVIERAFDAGMGHRDRLPPDALEEYRRPFAGGDGARAFARWASASDVAAVAGRSDELAALEIPVFLLWGEDDAFEPVEAAERLNELIPRSSLALLPGCRHFVPEDAPETVAPLLYEYLRSAYVRAPHVHETGPATIELGRRFRDAGADGG